jgi:anti-sigma factor RsiW
MNCETCTENLTAYLDRELASVEAREVREHLEACGPCRSEMHDLEHASQLVQTGAVDLDPRSELWDAVRTRVAALPVPVAPVAPVPRPSSVVPFRSSRWIRTTVLALAASLTVGVGVRSYWARQEAVRQEREAKALDEYMNQYIHLREGQEKEHLALRAVPASLTATVPVSATPHRQPRPHRTHREYFDNPFVNLADDAKPSPFKPVDPRAPEATK